MKRNVVLAFLSIALVALILAMTSMPGVSQAQPDLGKPYPINVGVGQVVSICKTGTIICPARSPICDDISVATVRSGKDGLEIVGVKPGKTLCSVVSAGGLRTIYGITVR
jgi:hypothetical protein